MPNSNLILVFLCLNILDVLMIRFFCTLSFLALIVISACSNPEQQSYQHLMERIIVTTKATKPSVDSIAMLLRAIEGFMEEYPETEHKRTLREREQLLQRQLLESRYQHYVELYRLTTERSYPDVHAAIDAYTKCLDALTHQEVADLRANHLDLVRYIDNLRKAIDGLNGMQGFFETVYQDLESFNLAAQIGKRWESNRLLNKLWTGFVGRARRELAKQVLIQSLPYARPRLQEYAGSACEGAYTGFEVERVEAVSFDEPQEDPNHLAYFCSAIFRVYLRGAYLGIDKAVVKLRVRGTLAIKLNEEGVESSLTYVSNDYEVLEKQGV